MARYAAQAILLGVTVAITTAAPAGAQTYRLADHRAYSREIADAAARHAVPERLVWAVIRRSEEHTSELQSPCNLVCRLLLEKKKKKKQTIPNNIITKMSQQYLLIGVA